MGPDKKERVDCDHLRAGVFYINIGTEKCCFFLPLSLFLCSRMKKFPLLYYAVEEALKCSQLGYYSLGVLALSQLLNTMKISTPDARHKVAHELLKHQPTKGDFDRIVQQVKEAAKSLQNKEQEKEKNPAAYEQKLQEKWAELMNSLLPQSAEFSPKRLSRCFSGLIKGLKTRTK